MDAKYSKGGVKPPEGVTKMTIEQALEMISRGETPEEYTKRIKRIKRLANERDALEDAIDVLGEDPRAEKKKTRLAKVIDEIYRLS